MESTGYSKIKYPVPPALPSTRTEAHVWKWKSIFLCMNLLVKILNNCEVSLTGLLQTKQSDPFFYLFVI